jgi:hypothetical protein
MEVLETILLLLGIIALAMHIYEKVVRIGIERETQARYISEQKKS